MKNAILFAVLLFFIIFCYLILSSNHLVFVTLPGNIPLGNIIAALCFILPSFGLKYHMADVAKFKSLRDFCWIASCLWLPVSMALSGNLQLTFVGINFAIWLIMSFVVGVSIIFALLHCVGYGITHLLLRYVKQA